MKTITTLTTLIWLALTTLATAGTATLAWDSHPSPEVTGYSLYAGQNGTYQKLDVGLETSGTLSGLDLGSYDFFVTAYDAQGNESLPSNEPPLTHNPAPDTWLTNLRALGQGLTETLGLAITELNIKFTPTPTD